MNKRLNRRRFFRLALWGAPVLAAGEAALIELHWLKVSQLKLSSGEPSARCS